MPSIVELPDKVFDVVIQELLALSPAAPTKTPSQKDGTLDQDQRLEPLHTFQPWLSDAIALSCTCRSIRTLLAPYIFRTVFLCNSERSARSLQAIAAGNHMDLVREIRYAGYPTNENVEEMGTWEHEKESFLDLTLDPVFESDAGGHVGEDGDDGRESTQELAQSTNQPQRQDDRPTEIVANAVQTGKPNEDDFLGQADWQMNEEKAGDDGDGGNQDAGGKHDLEKLRRERDDLFPNAVRDVLSNLSRFPNLEGLSMEFPFSWHDIRFEDGTDVTTYTMEDLPIFTRNSTQPWKAMMARSMDAICANPPSSIRSFRLPNFHAMAISTFTDRRFHRLLNQLETFHIDWRRWVLVDMVLNAFKCLEVVNSKLDTWFFNHLSSCQEFIFHGNQDALFGTGSKILQPELGLKLRPDHLPRLRRLDLAYVSVASDVISFLQAKRTGLESLKLHEAFQYSRRFDREQEMVYWHQVFQVLVADDVERLTELEIELTEKRWDEMEELPRDEEEEMMALERNVQAGHRQFPYATIFDRYGDLNLDEELTYERFLEGLDQKWYERLVELVNTNARRNQQRSDRESSERRGSFDAQHV